MRLPPELQSLVCRDLTKTELKVARLVCKSFDQAAVPFLFDEVFVAARYSDLEIADLVASRFGAYVKTVTLSCVEYENLSMGDYFERIARSTSTLPRINGHLAHAFGVYSKVQEENLEIMNSGKLIAKLCFILGKSPNTRKMILTDHGNHCDGYYRSRLNPHDPWRKDELCPFQGCELSESDHMRLHVRPSPPYQMTQNPFHLAMLAISMANFTITDLAMIHYSHRNYHTDCCSFLTKDSFMMTVEQFHHLSLQLQHLTKLRMRLDDEDEETQSQNSYASQPIAKALSSAINLESLFIEGNCCSEYVPREFALTTMSNFLGGCQFAKLRSLILKFMNSKDDELLEFLESSPALKHLTLVEFELESGSWEFVAQRIRSLLRLKSVMLDRLSCGFPDINLQDYEKCSNDQRLVEDFFLQNGKNPFTKAATDLWFKNKCFKTMREINTVLRCEKRYEMFH